MKDYTKVRLAVMKENGEYDYPLLDIRPAYIFVHSPGGMIHDMVERGHIFDYALDHYPYKNILYMHSTPEDAYGKNLRFSQCTKYYILYEQTGYPSCIIRYYPIQHAVTWKFMNKRTHRVDLPLHVVTRDWVEQFANDNECSYCEFDIEEWYK